MKNWIIAIIVFILAIFAYILYRIKSSKSAYVSDAYLDQYTGNNTQYNNVDYVNTLSGLLSGGLVEDAINKSFIAKEEDFWEDPNFWVRLSNTGAGEQIAQTGLNLVSDIFGGLTSGFGLF